MTFLPDGLTTVVMALEGERPLRVAVLEDSRMERRLIQRALAPASVTMQAGSLQEATSWVEKEGVDVILLDRQLPDGDGWSMSEELRRAHPGITIFVYTGEAAPLMRPAGVHWLDKHRMHEWRDTIVRVAGGA